VVYSNSCGINPYAIQYSGDETWSNGSQAEFQIVGIDRVPCRQSSLLQFRAQHMKKLVQLEAWQYMRRRGKSWFRLLRAGHADSLKIAAP
jgi:hypothetical protein